MLDNNWQQEWFRMGAKSRNETFDETRITKARREAFDSVRESLSSDPQLSGLSPQDYIDATELALTWRLVDSNERINSTAAFEMARYRLHLLKSGINPESRPPNWSEIFQSMGFDYVTHAAGIEDIMKILQERKITPRSFGNRRPNLGASTSSDLYVYAELPTDGTVRERPSLAATTTERGPWFDDLVREEGGAVIISIKAFDLFKWSHGNSHWLFGENSKAFSLPPDYGTVGFLNFLDKVREKELEFIDGQFVRHRFASEWLFTEPIELDPTKLDFRILVHPSKRDSFISQARAKKIPESIIQRIE